MEIQKTSTWCIEVTCWHHGEQLTSTASVTRVTSPAPGCYEDTTISVKRLVVYFFIGEQKLIFILILVVMSDNPNCIFFWTQSETSCWTQPHMYWEHYVPKPNRALNENKNNSNQRLFPPNAVVLLSCGDTILFQLSSSFFYSSSVSDVEHIMCLYTALSDQWNHIFYWI